MSIFRRRYQFETIPRAAKEKIKPKDTITVGVSTSQWFLKALRNPGPRP